MRGDDVAQVEFPFLRRRGPLALIGLSSAVPSAPFMATGWLGDEQITRLAELLDRCRQERSFRVVLIHHPPVSTSRRHFKRLIDGASFRAVLKRHGAEIVIHGHDHVHSLIHLEGPQRPIPALGVPSASQVSRAEHGSAGYSLYRIEGQAGAWRCEIVARGLLRDGKTMTETRTIAIG
jgi:3',5'-cyclic AMP phosphodiesterase CpdA